MRALPALALVFLLLFAPSADAAPLRLCYEDVSQFPWTMPDGSGLNFALLRRVEKLSGERFTFFVRPWKRCMEETKHGRMDGMIGAADSPARRSFALPPLRTDGTPDPARALYQDRVNVFLRTGSGASWDGVGMVNPANMVIAQGGYYVADLLRAKGYDVIDSPKSAEDGLRALAAGSADVAVLQGQDARDLVHHDPRFQGRVTMASQPFVLFDFYLMFGKKSYAAQRPRIEAVWEAIRKARVEPAYQKLEADTLR